MAKKLVALREDISQKVGGMEPKTIYEVERIDNRGNYKLLGVAGVYPVTLFRDIPIYLCITTEVPQVGTQMGIFWRIEPSLTLGSYQHSSVITKVTQLYDNVYEVWTKNTIYITQVKLS